MSNIAKQPSQEIRYSSGIGYVVIPDSRILSRDNYIVDCYKNSWVSIYIENEGTRERVHCDISTFNSIYFPEKYKELGTTVVWVFDKLKGLIYIVSTLISSSNYEHMNEYDFKLIKRYVEEIEKIKGNSTIKYGMTTNGTIWGQEIEDFFRKYKDSFSGYISISLDGDCKTHNKTFSYIAIHAT